MHKRKDGKIVASLTEVKNKTGDIFSLVDEFGEVLLTSYNKPRYRITKIGVADMLGITEKPEEAPKEEKPKSVMNRVKETVTNLAKPAKKEEVEIKEEWSGLISKELMQKLSNFKPWESNSKDEQKFLKNALSPLQ